MACEFDRGGSSEGHDHFRLDGLELTLEVGVARQELGFRWGGVFRRATEKGVGHVDRVSINSESFEHPVEELPRGTNKGLSRNVLLMPRGLSNERDLWMIPGAFSEHDSGPGLMQIATGAGRGFFLKDAKCDKPGRAIHCVTGEERDLSLKNPSFALSHDSELSHTTVLSTNPCRTRRRPGLPGLG